jgi:hypothetical protein
MFSRFGALGEIGAAADEDVGAPNACALASSAVQSLVMSQPDQLRGHGPPHNPGVRE